MQHCSRLPQCAPGLHLARDSSSHVPEAGTSGSGSPTDGGTSSFTTATRPSALKKGMCFKLGKSHNSGTFHALAAFTSNRDRASSLGGGPLYCGVRHPLYQPKYGEMHQAYDLDHVLHINTCENRTGATGDVFGRRW